MAKSLVERIQAARQSRVPSQGKTFVVRRPTDLEMVEMRDMQVKQGDLITRFVCGWDGFTELDLVPGGGPDPVPFAADVFGEYIADHPEHWDAITRAVMDGYQAHKTAQGESLKNSPPGSTT